MEIEQLTYFKINQDICNRCKKHTEIFEFSLIPQRLCYKCLREVIKKRMRKQMKLGKRILIFKLDDEYYDKFYSNLINFVLQFYHSVEIIHVDVKDTKPIVEGQNADDKAKDKDVLIIPFHQETLDILFLYALFYNLNFLRDLDRLMKLKNPLKEISISETFAILFKYKTEKSKKNLNSKKNSKREIDAKVLNAKDSFAFLYQQYANPTNAIIEEIRLLRKLNLLNLDIDTDKTKKLVINLIISFLNFAQKYKGIIESLEKSISNLKDLGLL